MFGHPYAHGDCNVKYRGHHTSHVFSYSSIDSIYLPKLCMSAQFICMAHSTLTVNIYFIISHNCIARIQAVDRDVKISRWWKLRGFDWKMQRAIGHSASYLPPFQLTDKLNAFRRELTAQGVGSLHVADSIYTVLDSRFSFMRISQTKSYTRSPAAIIVGERQYCIWALSFIADLLIRILQ